MRWGRFWIIFSCANLILAILCAAYAFRIGSLRPLGLNSICFFLVSVSSFVAYRQIKKNDEQNK